MTPKQLSLFCRQLSVMVNSGIPLLSALKVLISQTENRLLKDALTRIGLSLEGGKSFSAALAEHPQVFPPLIVTMICAGEAGGVLGEILDNAADFLEWEYRLREKVKASVTYPLLVLILSLLAVTFMVVFILPVFGSILQQMNTEIPLITRLLLGLSQFLRKFWYLAAGLTGGVTVILAYIINHSPQVREILDTFVLKLPVVGELRKKVIVSRFCKTTAILLGVGIPVLEALEIVEKTTGNVAVERSIAISRKNIFDGQGMAGSLRQTGVFPSVVLEMITVGEETGALGVMLEKAGEFYDEEVNNQATKLATVIEPLLICVVGAVVCVILLSVFLPMFKIIGSVG